MPGAVTVPVWVPPVLGMSIPRVWPLAVMVTPTLATFGMSTVTLLAVATAAESASLVVVTLAEPDGMSKDPTVDATAA